MEGKGKEETEEPPQTKCLATALQAAVSSSVILYFYALIIKLTPKRRIWVKYIILVLYLRRCHSDLEFYDVQKVASNSGDRRSVDAVVMRTTPGDLECTKSRRSSEIFESLRLDRQRSYEQAKQEGKKIIEVWKEQGWHRPTSLLILLMAMKRNRIERGMPILWNRQDITFTFWHRHQAPVVQYRVSNFKPRIFRFFCARIIVIFWTTCIASEVFSLVVMGNGK